MIPIFLQRREVVLVAVNLNDCAQQYSVLLKDAKKVNVQHVHCKIDEYLGSF